MDTVDDDYCYSDEETVISMPVAAPPSKHSAQIMDAYADDMFPDIPCIMDVFLSPYDTGFIKITCENIGYSFDIASLTPLKIKAVTIANESITTAIDYIARKNLLQIFANLLCIPTFIEMSTFLTESFTLIHVKEIPILSTKKVSVSESAAEVAELLSTPISAIFKKKNPFTRLINITKYCTHFYAKHCSICGRVLREEVSIPVCNNDLCKYNMIESPQYFDVATCFKRGKLPLLSLFTDIAIEAVGTSKISILLSPLQQCYIDHTDKAIINTRKLIENLKSIKEIILIFNYTEIDSNAKILEIIRSYVQTTKLAGIAGDSADIELKDKMLTLELYSTIWWLLCTIDCDYITKSHIVHSGITLEDAVVKNPALKGIIVTRHSRNEYNEVCSMHPEKKQITVYHGSATCNWLSIMRHGLKNLSDTAHMANGAAYGSGIYTASAFETAFGYSLRGATSLNFVAKCSALPVSIRVGGNETAVRCEPTTTFFIFVDDRYLAIDYVLVFG